MTDQALTLIAGLGNPESRYERTLHNAGFWFADEVARRFGGTFRYEKRFDAEVCTVAIAGREVRVAKPQSYMNNSGLPLRSLLDFFKLRTGQMLVAHDEIDLPPETVRLKKGGGHGGHNGLRDIVPALGNNRNFHRLRIGIDHPGHASRVTGYVLSQPSRVDRERIDASIEEAIAALPLLLDGDATKAMTRLHSFSAARAADQ